MDEREIAKSIRDELGVEYEEAEKIVEKAKTGGEINDSFDGESWLHERLLPNCVLIDEINYARMCIDALKILSTTAATDYGSSRQRDLGQLWADMTRGYLGEMAFVLFLKQKWNIDSCLGHEAGNLEDFLPSDIHSVMKPGDTVAHPPNINIGIKAGKWNGIWLDIPGDQFRHSDIHIFVKVGTGRDHLFSFFKQISVFRDKVLAKGMQIDAISSAEATEMYDRIPSFRPIPAYICGFVKKDAGYSNLSYQGKKGRTHYTIKSWNGPIRAGDLDTIKQRENLSANGNVQFEGIGNFSHDNGYLFNTGNLLWKQSDWESVIQRL